MSDQTVYVSAGANEPTFERTITEAKGKDITADTITVSLGSYDAPAAWSTPNTLTRPTPSTAVVTAMVSSATPHGEYFLWVRIGDGVSISPRRSPGRIIVT